MLRLVKVLLGASLLWSLYWFAAGWGLRNSISTWFAEQQRQGWQAEYSSLGSDGFPTHHTTRITSPTLADPGTGTAWRADWLEVDSPAIWPGRQTLRFAPTPQRLSYFDQTAVIETANMQAQLHLEPGLALTLEAFALSSDHWRISTDDGSLVDATSMQLGMVRTSSPLTYRVDFVATEFTPGPNLRHLFAATDALPSSFETLGLDMEVTFDTSWNRSALELRRPQPRHINLKLADAHWGALRLKATGELQVDERGSPTGVIALKIEHWREMLSMAEQAGALPASARDGIERVLALFSGFGGNSGDLDTQLTIRDGYVSLGPIPIGTAPRLILR
ncbi:DUF2125 domain-containing protein [Parasedimentitalea maritima]|uniref:DUF2125 domain-containing protein n=1 Tax=Parasedimentitalea maritima TaxID=2578117 RepID=UPI001ADC3D8C|nr:DUF2125 domain-containing protein [Zongyanglinia marina]